MWMQKFTKFKNKVMKWKMKDLTIEEKKLLINLYRMSSLSYLKDIYISHLSPEFIKQTKDLIADFLWSIKSGSILQKHQCL